MPSTAPTGSARPWPAMATGAAAVGLTIVALMTPGPTSASSSALTSWVIDTPQTPQGSVPPNASAVPPVRIDIPNVDVSAPVDALGLNEDGTMEVPEDFARTGWYERLEAPGEVGTAVIVGHVDSHTGPAAFFRIRELESGDEILVTLADGAVVRFVVERTEQYAKDQFPTIAVYGPVDRPTLRLITCGGSFDRNHGHYRDNVVVYASAQEET